jgi:AMP-polyphosphate phosphotransferase
MTSSVFHALNQHIDAPPSDYESRVETLSRDLGRLQRDIREAGIPVVVLFEGWEAAGKGTAINSLLLALDPRGFKVHTIQPPTKEERLHPRLWRFWTKLPEAGNIAIFDRSWYDKLFDPERQSRRGEAVSDVLAFERTLTDSGLLLLKFFLHISSKEQTRPFKKLRADRVTA